MSLTNVPTPPPDAINTGVRPCPTRRLVATYGPPANPKLLTDRRCLPQALMRDPWKRWMRTREIGPFRATGHRAFLDYLTQFHTWLKDRHPHLYGLLGAAGCLCPRYVRGAPGVLSNHALGLAIDYTIAGRLDVRGDSRTLQALLELYGEMKRFTAYVDLPPLYWGAGFRTEDSMHFEASAELVEWWERHGEFRRLP